MYGHKKVNPRVKTRQGAVIKVLNPVPAIKRFSIKATGFESEASDSTTH